MNLLLIVVVAVVLIVAMGQVLILEYKAPAEEPVQPGTSSAGPSNSTERDRAA